MAKTAVNADGEPLTSLDALAQAAECLRVLAHPHRLRMIQMLLRGNYTVTELAEACELPTAMASEHLRLMQRCGFLNSDKQGRKVFYRVTEPALRPIRNLLPNLGGVDLSPLVLLLGLQAARMLLAMMRQLLSMLTRSSASLTAVRRWIGGERRQRWWQVRSCDRPRCGCAG